MLIINLGGIQYFSDFGAVSHCLLIKVSQHAQIKSHLKPSSQLQQRPVHKLVSVRCLCILAVLMGLKMNAYSTTGF